ncbi:hypothetical protein BJ742DRAFT_224901 [Cladochytrium replicatum]|nr:hypothetical protein BJ742DRAFT_224901 [Cladochytrium replicatum]
MIRVMVKMTVQVRRRASKRISPSRPNFASSSESRMLLTPVPWLKFPSRMPPNSRNSCVSIKNSEVSKSFVSGKGLKLLRKWLVAISSGEGDVASTFLGISIMKLLKLLPIEFDHLKETMIGKIVRQVGKKSENQDLKTLALEVEEKWRGLVHEKKNTKRERDEDEGDAPAAKSANTGKKPTGKELSTLNENRAKKPKVSDEAAAAALQQHLQQFGQPAVDIFRDTSKDSLPRFRRTDKVGKSDGKAENGKEKETPSVTTQSAHVPGMYRRDRSDSPTGSSGPTAMDTTGDTHSEKSGQKRPHSPTDQAITNTTDATEQPPEKKKKKSKRVTFAPDHLLRQIKIFESNPEEWGRPSGSGSGASAADEDKDSEDFHERGNVRDFERSEGKHAFRKMEAEIDYYSPRLVKNVTSIKRGENSEEANIQADRERTELRVFYRTEEQIPDNPREPTDPPAPPPREFTIIPLESKDDETETQVQQPAATAVPNALGALGALPNALTSSLSALLGQTGLGQTGLTQPAPTNIDLLLQLQLLAGLGAQPLATTPAVQQQPQLQTATLSALLQGFGAPQQPLQQTQQYNPPSQQQQQQPRNDYEPGGSYNDDGFDSDAQHRRFDSGGRGFHRGGRGGRGGQRGGFRQQQQWDNARQGQSFNNDDDEEFDGGSGTGVGDFRGRGRGGFRGRGRGRGGEGGSGGGMGRGGGGAGGGGGGGPGGFSKLYLVPCRFWEYGKCSKGNECTFRHGDDDPRVQGGTY